MKLTQKFSVYLIVLSSVLYGNYVVAQNYNVTISHKEPGIYRDDYTGSIIKASLCIELPLIEKAVLRWDYGLNTEMFMGGVLYFKNGRKCDVDAVYSGFAPVISSYNSATPLPPARSPQKILDDLEFWREYEAINNRKTPIQASPIYENTPEALNTTAAAAYKVFPFLDIDNPKANMKAIEAVLARRDEYISGGYTWADSLLNAVNDIGPLYATKKNTKKPSR